MRMTLTAIICAFGLVGSIFLPIGIVSIIAIDILWLFGWMIVGCA